jgi:hypothetical protein
LRFRSQYLINDRWGLVLASWMVSRWEQGLNFDDGVKGAGATGASYNLGDKFNFVAGVAVSSKMVGDGMSVNPYGQFSWKIDERHTFSTTGLGLLSSEACLCEGGSENPISQLGENAGQLRAAQALFYWLLSAARTSVASNITPRPQRVTPRKISTDALQPPPLMKMSLAAPNSL